MKLNNQSVTRICSYCKQEYQVVKAFKFCPRDGTPLKTLRRERIE